jgi:hypothetical protein
MPAATRCTICRHPRREQIETDLWVGGIGLRAMARLAGVSPQALLRHRGVRPGAARSHMRPRPGLEAAETAIGAMLAAAARPEPPPWRSDCWVRAADAPPPGGRCIRCDGQWWWEITCPPQPHWGSVLGGCRRCRIPPTGWLRFFET